MKVMILAAGRGKRLRPLTDETPKPLLKINHYSIIENLILRLKENGFTDLVINVAHLADKIMTTLGDGNRYGVTITYSPEEEGGLETGGGIVNALPLLGKSPFLVISSDIWTDYPFHKLRTSNPARIHLVLVENPPHHREGDFYFEGEKLLLSGEKKLTFGNIGVYHPVVFHDYKPSFFPLIRILRDEIAKGNVTGEHFTGEWRDLGSIEALENIRRDLSQQITPEGRITP